MTSNPALVADSGVVKTRISDHYLVYAVLNLKMPKPPLSFVIARCYKNYNPERFAEDLATIPWYENAVIDDATEKVGHFNNVMHLLRKRKLDSGNVRMYIRK